MSHTHDPAEWAQFLSLGVGFTATGWLLWLLLFEPFLGCDLDPRPALARATRDARLALRDAAVSAAALLMLLSPAAAPKGATHA